VHIIKFVLYSYCDVTKQKLMINIKYAMMMAEGSIVLLTYCHVCVCVIVWQTCRWWTYHCVFCHVLMLECCQQCIDNWELTMMSESCRLSAMRCTCCIVCQCDV